MISIKDVQIALVDLGSRLRQARILRNESMQVFAQRIGVSVPTLRDMETGRPTVQIGTWLTAFWALGELDAIKRLLAREESILQQMETRTRARLRAYKRPNLRS